MPINSRAKGARGERQWRDQLRENGYAAERGQQHAGGTDSPDVKCPDLPGLHFEVKAVQALNLSAATEQAKRDAGPGKAWVVAHKRNNCPWLVTMSSDLFFRLLRDGGEGLMNWPIGWSSAAPLSPARFQEWQAASGIELTASAQSETDNAPPPCDLHGMR